MAEISPRDLRARLHGFGLERDRLNTALARAADLATSDLAALEHIEQAGRLTQRELAERLLLTPSSVSVLIDRLEQARACRRVPHPTDRRATLLELTDDATRLSEQVGLPDYETAVERAAASLTPSQRAAAARFLDAVTKAAAAHVARLRLTPPTTGTIDTVRVPGPRTR
jgi:DNA-binding MarR family transcriptional regulator